MKIRSERSVLESAIEEGLGFATRRAFKHRDDPPTEEQSRAWKNAALSEIMLAIDAVFVFDEEEDA